METTTGGGGRGMKKSIVVPGETICVVEEFLPGRGASAEPSGYVKSRILGKVEYDIKQREVHVRELKQVDRLERGDRVFAEVKDVQEKIAVAEAFAKLPNTPLKYRRTGVILARRNDSMENMVGIGDIVLVEVSSIYRGLITFDIYPPGCGVVLATCNQCGRLMEKRDNMLVCSRCGSRERRRTVLKYGKIEALEELLGAH